MHAVVRSGQELVFLLPASHWLAGQHLGFLVGSNDVDTELRVAQCHVFHEVLARPSMAELAFSTACVGVCISDGARSQYNLLLPVGVELGGPEH